jgi:hypothetical protein
MGKTILILMLGVSTSLGIMANSRNRRYVESVDRVVGQYSDHTATNSSASGAYMALNRLYLNGAWRTGYNVYLAGDTVDVVLEDNGVDPTLSDREVRILSTGRSGDLTDLTEVMIFDGTFEEFAVWAKDAVLGVTTKDTLGIPDPSLLMDNAPFMPNFDFDGLINEAAAQGHVQSDMSGTWVADNLYPNGSFYYSGMTPNVTHVLDNLKVNGGRTIYGLYIVEGNVELQGSSRVQGVIILPNETSTITSGGGDPEESSFTGGIISWGQLDGSGNHISVTIDNGYMSALATDYALDNWPIRVTSWK